MHCIATYRPLQLNHLLMEQHCITGNNHALRPRAQAVPSQLTQDDGKVVESHLLKDSQVPRNEVVSWLQQQQQQQQQLQSGMWQQRASTHLRLLTQQCQLTAAELAVERSS
jgi:hypothetical protein